MEFNSQDQDIIDLLKKLKNDAGTYPEHMLVARRRSFLKQMTEVGLGVGAAQGIKNAARPPRTYPFASNLLETALIVAIVVEMSAMAYFYRDKLADFFQDMTAASGVQEITPSSANSTHLQSPGITSPPAVIFTSSSEAVATEPASINVTLTHTPLPDNTQAANQLNSTPDPKGNNGHHYGQTPKPERTKENNGGNGGNGGGGNKDPKPTKDK